MNSDHYEYNNVLPINYIWPKEISYHNPVRVVKLRRGDGWFRLQSGEKTDETYWDEPFMNLDW